MNDRYEDETSVTEVSSDSAALVQLTRGEIGAAMEYAERHPRSIKRFVDEVMQLATLNEAIAGECIYTLMRYDRESGENKPIIGPSARFAEIAAHSWGNCQAGARVVGESDQFVTAQGVFVDLQKNVRIVYEVQRRISGKNGKKFGADMIGVTANAACSIALRNAVFKGIPKAFWSPAYEAARRTIAGDFKTFAARRDDALKAFVPYGVSKEQVCAVLGVAGFQDISMEHLVILKGLLTSIQEGETTPEQAFPPASVARSGGVAERTVYAQADFDANLPKWRELITAGKKSADQIIATVESRATMTDEMKAVLRAPAATPASTQDGDRDIEFAARVESSLRSAASRDTLDVAADLLGEVNDPERRTELTALYRARITELEG